MFSLTRQKLRAEESGPGGSRALGFEFLAVAVLILLIPAGKSLGDPPEEPVWNSFPERLEIARFGPINRPIETGHYSDIIYVSRPSGSDENGEGSRQRPWKTVSRALTHAASLPAARRRAVCVGQGTYPETPVRMVPHVDLYGGFDETTWERDIWNHPTILDGETERRVVLGASDSRLDGFHILRGRTQGHGAGILCLRTSPRIYNNILQENWTVEPEGFDHNPSRRRHMGNDGGGIACVDGAHPEIAHNLIYRNGAEVGQGGGIACLNDSCPKIVYNFITKNETGTRDLYDTRTSNGGGISCFAGCLPIISNNLIANNKAGGRSDGGGIYCEYDGSPTVSFNYILGNESGDDGGGMEIMKGSYPRVDSNFLVGNRSGAVGGGGGIRISDRGMGEFTNNLIAANSRSGVVCSNAWMAFVNNTIVLNHGGGETYGLSFHNERWDFLSPPRIRNNLVWSNDTTHEVSYVAPASDPDGAWDYATNWSENSHDTGEPRSANPGLDERWLHGRILEMRPRRDRFTTEVRIEEKDLEILYPVGRPARFGSEWSVIAEAHDWGLEVFGWSEAATEVSVLPSFRLLQGSPCIDLGELEASPPRDFEGDPRGGGQSAADIGYDEFVEGSG